ncbi:MAG: hypothetical protein JXR95_04900 [Deltaproteobacteria bacterium]|nr:hypothetical protein [Deltaproteobacteria bacterium]
MQVDYKRAMLFVFIITVLMLLGTCGKGNDSDTTRRPPRLTSLPGIVISENSEVFPPQIESDNEPKPILSSLLKPVIKEENTLYTEVRGHCEDQKTPSRVVFNFYNKVVGASEIGKYNKKLKIKFDPEIKGEFKWTRSNELRFVPHEKFKNIQSKVYISDTVTGTSGDTLKLFFRDTLKIDEQCSIGTKVLGWKINPEKPQVVAFTECEGNYYYNSKPDGFRHMPWPKNGKCVAFDQTVSIEKVKKVLKMKVSIAGKDISVVPLILKEKAEMPSLRGKYFRITTKDPLPPNAVVSIDFIKDVLQQKQTDKKYSEKWNSVYEVPRELSVVKAACSNSDSCTVEKSVQGYKLNGIIDGVKIAFNNELKDLYGSKLSELIKITPKINVTTRVRGNTIYIKTSNFKPGIDYSITVDRKLQDTWGYYFGKKFRLNIVLKEKPGMIYSPRVVTVDKKSRAGIRIASRNIKKIRFSWLELSSEQLPKVVAFIRKFTDKFPVLSKPQGEKVYKLQSIPNKVQTYIYDFQGIRGIKFGKVYLVSVSDADSDRNFKAGNLLLVQTTDKGITTKVTGNDTLIMVRSLQTGKNISGVKVNVIDIHSGNGRLLLSEKTSQYGTVVKKNQNLRKYKELLVTVEDGTSLSFHLHRRVEHLLDKNPSFSSNVDDLKDELSGTLILERGIFRPGEFLNFKGIIRKSISGSLKAVSGEDLKVVITAPDSSEIYSARVKTTEFGSFSVKTRIPLDVKLGNHQITVKSGKPIASTWFKIEEFRKPRFEVNISLPKENVVAGSEITGTIAGRYFSGPPMKERTARYFSNCSYTIYTPPGFDDYSFYSSGTSASCLHYIPGVYQKVQLDANGSTSFKTEIRKSDGIKPILFTVNGEVKDIDNQSIVSSKKIIVHPSENYIGVKVDKWGYSSGSTVRVNSVTVSPDGKGCFCKGQGQSVRDAHSTCLELGKNQVRQEVCKPHMENY